MNKPCLSFSSLSFLETYVQEQVLPDYGNTHTTTTVTSLQTTLFRHEARYNYNVTSLLLLSLKRCLYIIQITFGRGFIYSSLNCRDIIRNAVNASEHDAVIFTGSGCTGAVHKLIHALNFEKPPVSLVII